MIEFDVEAEDLREGKPCDSNNCAIARSMQRNTVHVLCTVGRVSISGNDVTESWIASRALQSTISKIDRKVNVEPFRVRLIGNRAEKRKIRK